MVSLIKSSETGISLSTSSLSTSYWSSIHFKLLKPLGTFFNLPISSLFTSDFKLAKLAFLAKDDVWTAVVLFKSVFIA